MNNGQMNYPAPVQAVVSPKPRVIRKIYPLGIVSIIGTLVFSAAAIGMMFLPMMLNREGSAGVSAIEYSVFGEFGRSQTSGDFVLLAILSTVLLISLCTVFLFSILFKLLSKFIVPRIFAIVVTLFGALGSVGYLIYVLNVFKADTYQIGLYLIPACSVLAFVCAVLGMFGHKKIVETPAPANTFQNGQYQGAPVSAVPTMQQPAGDAMLQPPADPVMQQPVAGQTFPQVPDEPVPPQSPVIPADPQAPDQGTAVPQDSFKGAFQAPDQGTAIPQDSFKSSSQVPPAVVVPASIPELDTEPKQAAESSKEEFDDFDPPTTVQTGGIVGICGDYEGADISINPGEKLIIGRDAASCNIVIGSENKDISRVHCSVKFDNYLNCYKVIDTSSNGTFVDGKPLTRNEEAQLPKGTVISLGRGKNQFRLK